MKKAILLVLMAAAVTILPGCKKTPLTELTPQSFTTDYAALVAERSEKALASYAGKTYRLNARVEAIISEYVFVCCSENAKIRIYLPQSELKGLKKDEVIAFEGTVKEVKTETWNDRYSAEMVIEDAHVIGTAFEVTGRVEELYWDYTRDGQYYAAIWDSSVVVDRQINIYLPEDHTLEVGDSITARGALLYPAYTSEYTVAYIKNRGFPEVFVMPEPEFIRKEGGE